MFKKRKRTRDDTVSRNPVAEIEEVDPLILSSKKLHKEKKDESSTLLNTFESTKSVKPTVYGGDATAAVDIDGNVPPPSRKVGPMKAPSNLRTTVRFDYQADICKDYKETGYCGYGDNCKFMHDRGDYKSGWELEKEWASKKKEEKVEPIAAKSKPFGCHICCQPFVPPVVVTLCKHYFCQQCAFQHYATSAKCATCNKQTKGVFNISEPPNEK